MFAKVSHPLPGRKHKAMVAVILLFTAAGLLAFTHGSVLVGAAIWLFTLILGVQWLCISPPWIDEHDIP